MPEETLQIRIHWPEAAPTLIYLPGLHGDWTLVGGFRKALEGQVRFVELTYPRTLTWSLDVYAAAIEQALASQGISEGWLLGESFGSQILWALLKRGNFKATAAILAGGFVRHPMQFLVWFAERFAVTLPYGLFRRSLSLYGRIARWRYRRCPEVVASVNAFLERRTDLDRHAAKHRLRLIKENDLCAVASRTNVPVYALTGAIDPIVAWLPVRRWLRRNCPTMKDYKVIWRADHTVLATGAEAAARQVLQWMKTK